MFYVLLTVNLITVFVNNQIDAQFIIIIIIIMFLKG